MIIKIQPDKAKSESLSKMAMVTLQRLKEIDFEKYPSNTLLDYYCIIHKLMEAIALSDGIKTTGEGAHRELIEYVVKKSDFEKSISDFLQQMRDYRNRISYEGFIIKKNYITLNNNKIVTIINKLNTLIKSLN